MMSYETFLAQEFLMSEFRHGKHKTQKPRVVRMIGINMG